MNAVVIELFIIVALGLEQGLGLFSNNTTSSETYRHFLFLYMLMTAYCKGLENVILTFVFTVDTRSLLLV